MRGLFEVLKLKKDENHIPQLEMTEKARCQLRTALLRENPQLSEFPFLGLGEGVQIEEIIVGELSKIGLRQLEDLCDSGVDRSDLESLFVKVSGLKTGKRVMLLGHCHPSGSAMIGGVRFVIEPRMSLLDPSMGSRLGEGGDLAFYREFAELNPGLLGLYHAIAANTELGPKMRIYNMARLLKMKRYNDIEKVPQLTIDL